MPDPLEHKLKEGREWIRLWREAGRKYIPASELTTSDYEALLDVAEAAVSYIGHVHEELPDEEAEAELNRLEAALARLSTERNG